MPFAGAIPALEIHSNKIMHGSEDGFMKMFTWHCSSQGKT
jgi:hypothetical protein